MEFFIENGIFTKSIVVECFACRNYCWSNPSGVLYVFSEVCVVHVVKFKHFSPDFSFWCQHPSRVPCFLFISQMQ
jgi:hypothetical protein